MILQGGDLGTGVFFLVLCLSIPDILHLPTTTNDAMISQGRGNEGMHHLGPGMLFLLFYLFSHLFSLAINMITTTNDMGTVVI